MAVLRGRKSAPHRRAMPRGRRRSARASEQQLIFHDPLRPFVNVVISSSLCRSSLARSLHLGKIKVASPPPRPEGNREEEKETAIITKGYLLEVGGGLPTGLLDSKKLSLHPLSAQPGPV